MENENQFGNIKQGKVIGNINDKEFEARMKKEQEEKVKGVVTDDIRKRC